MVQPVGSTCKKHEKGIQRYIKSSGHTLSFRKVQEVSENYVKVHLQKQKPPTDCM